MFHFRKTHMSTKLIMRNELFELHPKNDAKPWKPYVFMRRLGEYKQEGDSRYSTEYTRAVARFRDLLNITIETDQAFREKGLNIADLNLQWRYCADRAVEIWPFLYDPNSVARTLFAAQRQINLHYRKTWAEKVIGAYGLIIWMVAFYLGVSANIAEQVFGLR